MYNVHGHMCLSIILNPRILTEPRKVEAAWEPQIIGALAGLRITDVIAGPCATHSFFITDDGRLFGLGMHFTIQ